MNSFFGLGPMELLVIVFLALIVLGPQRLPGTIREVMKYWRYFRNLSGELTSQLGEEFKDLEDLNPQRMLEDLASELDDEVEQTKEAASLKKKPASKSATKAKSTTKKSTAAKKSTAKSASANDTLTAKTGSDTSEKSTESSEAPETDQESVAQTEADEESTVADSVEEPRKSDVSAAATASAAAASAMAKSASGGDDAALIDAGETSEPPDEDNDVSAQAVQSPAQNGDVPTAEPQPEPAGTTTKTPDAERENTILPPQDSLEAGGDSEHNTDDEADIQPEGIDESVNETASLPTAEDVPDAFEGEDQAVNRTTVGSAEPAPVSVNGKGVRPEDEG